jgi:DNA recombination protein RmuC
MFLPGEVFFSAALQEDPSLIEAGVSEKVVVATPTTLIALLRAVAYGWRQEALAQNAKEIALLGKDLYSRITTLAEHWNKVGERLGRTVEAYNKSTGSLETSVLRSARKLRDLKVSADDLEITELDQVEKLPRMLQAEEFDRAKRRRASVVELTDAEALEAAKSDPDCPPLTDEQLKRMRRVVPRGNGFYGPPKRS